MSTSTPSSTCSSIIPSYSSSNLTELYATYTVPSYRNVDRVEIVDNMINSLMPKLFSFIDVLSDYDASTDTHTYYGRLKVAPLSTKCIVRNNLYTLATLPFTESEINDALHHTYPERFI